MARLGRIARSTIAGLARAMLYLWVVLYVVWLVFAIREGWWESDSFLSFLLVMVAAPAGFAMLVWAIARAAERE
ncbi:MAG TPA: hypothetical protein VE688_09160 [Gaiellaceae bacterium]|jgi:hypothetical protein|nr:hypothetical protein [Gaiellaceae bacterium]